MKMHMDLTVLDSDTQHGLSTPKLISGLTLSLVNCRYTAIYSGPPLIRTHLLPNNAVFIREVSFGEREHYTHS